MQGDSLSVHQTGCGVSQLFPRILFCVDSKRLEDFLKRLVNVPLVCRRIPHRLGKRPILSVLEGL
jgi:hypothetical protein